MQATIRIDMGNAAFEERPGAELARILRELAERIEEEATDLDGRPRIGRIQLHDRNGNTVGAFSLVEEKDPPHIQRHKEWMEGGKDR